jgi:hypothetical protein
MDQLNPRHFRRASDAVASTRRKREIIGHQIDSLRDRTKSLPADHPAQRGIERTIESLNVEYQAED